MRFGLAHKSATYLMVAAAYIGLAGGGGVSPVIALLGFVGLITSWWWEPPIIRYEKWALAWTLASLLVLAYAVLSAVATGDYLGVGGEFLIWLTVAKACNRRAARDWQQLYLLAFLMLVAGSVLNADLNYGIAFLVFVVASTWALTLFHLRREMEDNFLLKHADDRASERVEVRRILASRRIVDGRFFAGTGLVSLGVFVASAVFFLAMPRIGMGFFFKSRGGLTMAGFRDGVKIGTGQGTLKLDATVVMRVEIAEKYGGLHAPMIHWRGVAFDHYAGGEWRRSEQAPESAYSIQALGSRKEVRTLNLIQDNEVGLVHQQVLLEQLDTDVLFGASQPVKFEVDAPRTRGVRERNDEVRLTHGDQAFYQVWSRLDPPSADALRADDEDVSGYLPMFVQLPCEEVVPTERQAVGDDLPVGCRPGEYQITERTHHLAEQITAPYSNNYDRAVAIVRWLQTNLTYTLDLVDAPAGEDPVEFFLFERKKGHCEYFATAFAILARAVNIPTRNVDGFLGGEWNEYADYVAVRAGDAHSWDEVYFPNHGWVTFDPTPPGNIDLMGRGSRGALARLRRFLDRIRYQWSKWVIEYDLYRQLSLFKGVGRGLKAAGRAVKRAAVATWDVAQRRWYAVVALGALLLFGLRRRRRRSGPARRADRERRRRAVAEIWSQVVTRLARRGLVRDPALTPRELARRWTAAGAGELAELTELYYSVEYGSADEAAALPRARGLRDAIEAALHATR